MRIARKAWGWLVTTDPRPPTAAPADNLWQPGGCAKGVSCRGILMRMAPYPTPDTPMSRRSTPDFVRGSSLQVDRAGGRGVAYTQAGMARQLPDGAGCAAMGKALPCRGFQWMFGKGVRGRPPGDAQGHWRRQAASAGRGVTGCPTGTTNRSGCHCDVVAKGRLRQGGRHCGRAAYAPQDRVRGPLPEKTVPGVAQAAQGGPLSATSGLSRRWAQDRVAFCRSDAGTGEDPDVAPSLPRERQDPERPLLSGLGPGPRRFA